MPEPGLINVVVEIPAGTNDKWTVSKDGESLQWELKDGMPRVVQYLAYPANYGIVPRTRLPRDLGGDGDPLDVLLLGPALQRGSVVRARPIGVLRLVDDGEQDDKILALQTSGPLSDAADIEELEARYAGALPILEAWLTQYKGSGRIESKGIQGAEAALSVVREASRHFENAGTRSLGGPRNSRNL